MRSKEFGSPETRPREDPSTCPASFHVPPVEIVIDFVDPVVRGVICVVLTTPYLFWTSS